MMSLEMENLKEMCFLLLFIWKIFVGKKKWYTPIISLKKLDNFFLSFLMKAFVKKRFIYTTYISFYLNLNTTYDFYQTIGKMDQSESENMNEISVNSGKLQRERLIWDTLSLNRIPLHVCPNSLVTWSSKFCQIQYGLDKIWRQSYWN